MCFTDPAPSLPTSKLPRKTSFPPHLSSPMLLQFGEKLLKWPPEAILWQWNCGVLAEFEIGLGYKDMTWYYPKYYFKISAGINVKIVTEVSVKNYLQIKPGQLKRQFVANISAE